MEHQARGGSAQLPGREIRYCPPYLYAGKQIQYYRQICLSFACPLIVLLLIGCVALPSVAQQYPKEISPSCELNVTSRDRDINLRNTTSQPNQNLSRHHVIPARTLIKFFNTSLSDSNFFNGEHERKKLLTVLSNLASVTLAFYQSHPTRKINNKTMHLLTSFNNTVTYEDFQRIESPYNTTSTQGIINHLFVWMPFNIFEGPQLRTDDPGSEFEYAASPIIGEELWEQLKIINNEMIWYLCNGSEEPMRTEIFNDIISRLNYLISIYTWNLTVYDSSKWEKDENGRYHIKRENQTRSSNRKREINGRYNLDPYCFETEQFLIDHGDEIFQVTIAGKAFERAKYGDGFYSKNYNSWKDWYVTLNRSRINFPQLRGIIEHGRDMAKGAINGKPYGHKFNDGSFAVGIIGTNLKYGNDNWVTIAGGDRVIGDRYAGQIFFDKNWQPVALFISRSSEDLFLLGWSFIYNNGKWEHESHDDWIIRRFAGSTLSLDSHAPRFIIDNKDNKGYIHNKDNKGYIDNKDNKGCIETVKHIHDELKR